MSALRTIFLLSMPSLAFAQQHNEVAQKVTVCELKKNAAAYNHKVVEVTTFVSRAFEDFSLFDPTCVEPSGIWVDYGGTLSSGTIYCCGSGTERKRRGPVTVEGIAIPLVEDAALRAFDALIQKPPDAMVRATLQGRFFAGRIEKFRRGYGHMGCCSLFVIERVVTVDPQNRRDLDYRAEADRVGSTETCDGNPILFRDRSTYVAMQMQKRAEQGESDWAFADAKRVATEWLALHLSRLPAEAGGLKPHRTSSGQQVYQWRSGAKKYFIVVSRPFWLVPYAKDPHKIAWVVTSAFESEC